MAIYLSIGSQISLNESRIILIRIPRHPEHFNKRFLKRNELAQTFVDKKLGKFKNNFLF